MNALSHFLKRDQAGQAIVVISLVLLVLFMFTGLAVDAGQLYSARRTMQEAADSAAYAGAVVIYQGGTKGNTSSCDDATNNTSSQAYLAAVADATKNGFTNGVAGNTVTVNNPPKSGPYCGNASYVEVKIGANVKTSLVPAESGLTTVRVRGVAGAEPLNNGYAIMALDRGNTPSAFSTSSNADIHLTGGGIIVNSTNADAADNQQTSCTRFTVQSPYAIDIAGSTATTWPSCPAPNNFTENTYQPQVPDPFASFPKPSTTGMIVCANWNDPGCTASVVGDTRTMNPGIYTYSIGASGNSTVVLNPGIYILEAGINASGNADIQSTAAGVFLFNTKTNYPNSGAGDTCGALSIVGNGTNSIDAMLTGPYANMAVYQDPICSAAMTIAGNGSFTGSGTIYLPSANFNFNGNNATLTGSQLVAKTVTIQNGNINIDFNGGNTAQPILPRLSE